MQLHNRLSLTASTSGRQALDCGQPRLQSDQRRVQSQGRKHSPLGDTQRAWMMSCCATNGDTEATADAELLAPQSPGELEPSRGVDSEALPADILELQPIDRIEGLVQLPGSKSLSNRILLLAALSKDITCIENVLDSEDTQFMVAALAQLGVDVMADWAAKEVVIKGCGGRFPSKGAELYLGNAGTAMRPLTAAVAAAGRGKFVLDGTPRMQERPIQDLVDGLLALGVEVSCSKGTGCPPVEINAKGLRPGKIELNGNVSSQFLTAILMAAPLAEGEGYTEIICKDLISQPYVEMTVDLMAHFNVEVEMLEGVKHMRVPAGQTYKSPGRMFVEGDASSASYWLAGAALTGGKMTVEGCGSMSIQGDVRFADVMAQMGARVEWDVNSITITGPSNRKDLKGGDFDCIDIPDAAMTLAVVAAMANGPTHIRGVESWRVKETERMAAIVAELTKLGCEVQEFQDSCIITPPPGGLNAMQEIETYDDHRMAMAFALAACEPTKVFIRDPGCVRKTYPSYFSVLDSVSKRLERSKR